MSRRIWSPRAQGALPALLLVGALLGAGCGDEIERVVHPSIPPVGGVVFEDLDGDGARGEDEPGVPGVVVHRGFEVAVSDAEGRYVLAGASEARGSSNDGLVHLTRPDGWDCAVWYRPVEGGSLDFALVRRTAAAEDGFTFVHLSDAHVFDRASDFIDFSSGPRQWWMPEILRSAYFLYFTRKLAEPAFTDDFAAGLRTHLAEHLGQAAVDARFDVQLPGALLDELARSGSALSRVEEPIRAAFDELRALAPAFAIHTGDLILEANNGSAEAVERWMRFYRELTADLGFPVYDTIGNNEIAGIEHDGFDPGDRRYGKGLYRQIFGPSHYSFDRGRFHFVALDTHSQRRYLDDPRAWIFQMPERGFWSWLDRDLERHPGRVPVLVNHEPFVYDPAWPFDEEDFDPIDDKGRLARHEIPVVIAGHIHRNGLVRRDGTTHITTGALSGFRWVLPPDLYHRGYRLFHARGERLYSAWKRLDHPVVAFIDPPGNPAQHPAQAGGHATAGDGTRVVAVAADARGPFPGVRILLDGKPLSLERWGRYFVSAAVPAERTAGPGELVVEAISLDGRLIQDRARLVAGSTGNEQ
ncbi:MAG: metallophosphoesterase [Myxococcota bacterium]